MTIRPPGRSARDSSASPRPRSPKLRTPKATVTTSTDPAAATAVSSLTPPSTMMSSAGARPRSAAIFGSTAAMNACPP